MCGRRGIAKVGTQAVCDSAMHPPHPSAPSARRSVATIDVRSRLGVPSLGVLRSTARCSARALPARFGPPLGPAASCPALGAALAAITLGMRLRIPRDSCEARYWLGTPLLERRHSDRLMRRDSSISLLLVVQALLPRLPVGACPTSLHTLCLACPRRRPTHARLRASSWPSLVSLPLLPICRRRVVLRGGSLAFQVGRLRLRCPIFPLAEHSLLDLDTKRIAFWNSAFCSLYSTTKVHLRSRMVVDAATSLRAQPHSSQALSMWLKKVVRIQRPTPPWPEHVEKAANVVGWRLIHERMRASVSDAYKYKYVYANVFVERYGTCTSVCVYRWFSRGTLQFYSNMHP